MLTKTFFGGAAAALISFVALGATAASAAPYNKGYNNWNGGGNDYNGPYNRGGEAYNFGFGNNGWYFNFGVKPVHPKPVVQKVCNPTYKTTKVWQPGFGWVWQSVYAGQECQFVPVNPHPVGPYKYRNW